MAMLSATRRSHPLRWVAALVIIALVAVIAAGSFLIVQDNSRAQGAVSVRNAVINSAMQCAAVEGAYPSSVEYLEEHYGLTVNHDDFLITYEAFASNIMPSVVVVPK